MSCASVRHLCRGRGRGRGRCRCRRRDVSSCERVKLRHYMQGCRISAERKAHRHYDEGQYPT